VTPGRSAREKGLQAEAFACQFLLERGLTLVTRNYRTRRGEIDLIMQDGETLVFVEVRARSRSRFMHAAETIDSQKQRRLIHAGRCYLRDNNLTERIICRFDVVLLSGEPGNQKAEWITDAFEA